VKFYSLIIFLKGKSAPRYINIHAPNMHHAITIFFAEQRYTEAEILKIEIYGGES
jgi:hypothetical protein